MKTLETIIGFLRKNFLITLGLALIVICVLAFKLIEQKRHSTAIFQTVLKSMNSSLRLIEIQNSYTMYQFEKLYYIYPCAVKDFIDPAKECNRISDSLFNYIESLKARLVLENGGWVDPVSKLKIKHEGKFNISSKIMIREKKGDALFKKILEARKQYMILVNKVPTINYRVFEPNIVIDAKEPEHYNKTWAEENFHKVSAIAAVTLLTSFQADVRTTQSNIVDAIINSIPAIGGFDSLIAVYRSDNPVVKVGEKFRAKVFLAAYSSEEKIDIFINGKQVEVVSGVARYEDLSVTPGLHERPVTIKQLNHKTGEEKEYHTTIKYYVFQ